MPKLTPLFDVPPLFSETLLDKEGRPPNVLTDNEQIFSPIFIIVKVELFIKFC